MSATERVKEWLSAPGEYSGWGSSLTKDGLKFVEASSSPGGKTIFEFEAVSSHVNGLGNVHGGCTATIFDYCTSVALVPISREGFWKYVGVSRNLAVTYIRPIPVGEVVLVESEVVHAGKKLATLHGVMRRKSDGAVLATCEHLKVNIDPEVSSKL